MKANISVIALAVIGLAGCTSNQAPDVAANVRNSLKQAGLNNVTVSQNRDKGVVTLGGTVNQDADKARAEQVAKPIVGGQVLADEIEVLPNGDNSNAKAVNSDLDKGIEQNVDAALRQANIKGIHHSTNNGVVTLTGNLPSQAMRASAEHAAAGVPNVQQVVNEINVKNQRATSTSADRSSSADRSK